MRQRLEGVDHVSISQRDQLAAVTFVPGTRAFSPTVFRAALDAADIEMRALDIDACGNIVHDGDHKWMVVGAQRFRLVENSPQAGRGCVTGRLRDHDRGYELADVQVTRVGQR